MEREFLGGFISVYRLTEDGTGFRLIHKTPVDGRSFHWGGDFGREGVLRDPDGTECVSWAIACWSGHFSSTLRVRQEEAPEEM